MKRYVIFFISMAAVFWIFLLALSSKGAYEASDKNIIYEELTCAELQAGSEFNRASLDDLDRIYIDCLVYATSPDNNGFGDLYCAFIMEQGQFILGVIQDLDAVYEIKCVRGLENE